MLCGLIHRADPCCRWPCGLLRFDKRVIPPLIKTGPLALDTVGRLADTLGPIGPGSRNAFHGCLCVRFRLSPLLRLGVVLGTGAGCLGAAGTGFASQTTWLQAPILPPKGRRCVLLHAPIRQ